MSDFDVRLAADADVGGVLAALSDGYGRPFTRYWFDWKHRESPWGASRCFLAEDEGGLLGVVFAMPWRFAEAGHRVNGWRMVDGATTVRAQRRGVFRSVVAELLTDCASSSMPGVVLATATPEARLAHIKNGAATLEPIQSYYRPARWSRAAVVVGESALESWVAPTTDAVSTAWDVASLKWRLDARGGSTYMAARLLEANSPNGLVYRVVGGAARTLVIAAAWGGTAEVRCLTRAVARRTKSMSVLSHAGEGTPVRKPRVGLARGESLMCVWDQRSSAGVVTASRDGWTLDGLDLEGVI